MDPFCILYLCFCSAINHVAAHRKNRNIFDICWWRDGGKIESDRWILCERGDVRTNDDMCPHSVIAKHYDDIPLSLCAGRKENSEDCLHPGLDSGQGPITTSQDNKNIWPSSSPGQYCNVTATLFHKINPLKNFRRNNCVKVVTKLLYTIVATKVF